MIRQIQFLCKSGIPTHDILQQTFSKTLIKAGHLNLYRTVQISSSPEIPCPNDSSSTLVYEGPLKKRIKYVKFLSLSSSLVGFTILPVAVQDIAKTSLLAGGAVCAVSAFFLSTPFLLDYITRRYVIELAFDSSTKVFTARTFNLLSQVKESKFTASDVFVPDLPGMLTSFHANGKPLFVDSSMVKDVDAYCHMMGYDKPLEFGGKVDSRDDCESK